MKSLTKLTCSTLLSVLLGASFVVTANAAEAPKRSETVTMKAPVVTFNRLMKTSNRRHRAPIEEEIRDPNNADGNLLQPPMEVFDKLPKMPSGLGNGVAWVKAANDGSIAPRWDLKDPNAEPMVMDMNVVRVPRGRMPDVVFPHKQHTEWLDCSNCHPDIFIPQKGANQISMAAIILGQKCGVCHGKVAFPVAECRLCHSQPKNLSSN